LGGCRTVPLCRALRRLAANPGRSSDDPLRGLSHTGGVAMTAVGAGGHVGGMNDGGGSEVWPPPARESFCRNVRTKRTKRTKPVGRGLMGRMRNAVRPASQVCAGIGIMSAEENAAMAAGRSDGMDRKGNDHGI
jgi:hypothetical protein